MSKPRFFTKRIYLDNVFNRKTQDFSTHWVGSTFKAFAVVDTNDSNFLLTLTPDPDNGAIQGIPLQSGGWHNFMVDAKNGVFENSVAQSGVWVDVLISVQDPLTSGKIQAIVTAKSIISEGSTFSQTKITVTSTPTEIITANDDRRIGRLTFKSGTSDVWIGSESDLLDADYQNICMKIPTGDDAEWKLTGGCFAKTSTGSQVFSLFQGLN